MKKRIGILFGGPSGEHEVSIQSAINIYRALDPEKHEKILIGMDLQGAWRIASAEHPLLIGADGADALAEKPADPAQPAGADGADALAEKPADPAQPAGADGADALAEKPADPAQPAGAAVSPDGLRINPAAPVVIPEAGSGRVILVDLATAAPRQEIDVFFPIAHGTFGEDGCLQGLLKLLGAPFVGAGVLGSAAGMDKDVMKRLMRDAGIPVPRFVVVRSRERDQISFDVLSKTLGTPLFVKPCNLGSSVGIHKVSDAESFDAALADAFRYDLKVIIEEGIRGREIECSVLGNDSPLASVPGEIIVHADFYSYYAKYIDPDGAALEIPARLDKTKAQEIRDLAVRAFEALECQGMARVDFFLKEDGAVLVSELNTLPGFTRISMYPKMWEASGLSYGKLLDRLIELALERHEAESRLKRTYGD
jgi:D-alanine-D-alanine ligase